MRCALKAAGAIESCSLVTMSFLRYPPTFGALFVCLSGA
uniref:Uncharacterized protein n=1 Tax=Siphoviridae sp. ctFSL3 TaxID=2825404 RepID=A0A8S5PE45_9CAUD|nr:MAG TPA: hypothetical protein [Siphoviridae sp. ctFSL3]